MNYKEQKNWNVDIGLLESDMQEYKLPAVDDLVGKELKIQFNFNDWVINHVFHDKNSLTWEIHEGADKGVTCDESYEAILVAPNIYMVDFIKSALPKVSLSMILDFNTGKTTCLELTAPDEERSKRDFKGILEQGLDLGKVKAVFMHGNINPSNSDDPIVPHEKTTDLIGKRIKWKYSENHTFEHIYLNEKYYTWHCLAGSEKGLGDMDSCDYFKIAQDLYLFNWREKILPGSGVIIINLKDMTANGKLFGGDPVNTDMVRSFRIGAIGELISDIGSS